MGHAAGKRLAAVLLVAGSVLGCSSPSGEGAPGRGGGGGSSATAGVGGGGTAGTAAAPRALAVRCEARAELAAARRERPAPRVGARRRGQVAAPERAARLAEPGRVRAVAERAVAQARGAAAAHRERVGEVEPAVAGRPVAAAWRQRWRARRGRAVAAAGAARRARAARPRAAPIVLSDDGGWCWFESPRALFQGSRLIIGSVASGWSDASRRGDSNAIVHDLATGTTSTFELHNQLELDDHDSPAFLARPDGRIVTLYAKHGDRKPFLLPAVDRQQSGQLGGGADVHADGVDAAHV